MPAGPAVLAIKEGLPLVAAHVSYSDTGIHIDFTQIEIASADSEEKAVALTVQRIADAFARGIAQSPQDWHMLQRIWIDRELYA
jgi:KDO2-lipid IV(A) lauroyltransferase